MQVVRNVDAIVHPCQKDQRLILVLALRYEWTLPRLGHIRDRDPKKPLRRIT
jgi:hypothetical protein